jgi:hypothetical protein
MLHGYSTTVWQCRHCMSAMVDTTTPGGEDCIECVNPRCRWTVMAACRDILRPATNTRAYQSACSHVERLAREEQDLFYLLSIDNTLVICNDATLLATYPTLRSSAILFIAPDDLSGLGL